MLHPALKTAYFRQHNWPQEWIDEALRLLREEWTDHYRPEAQPSALSAGDIPPPLKPRRPGHLSAQRSSLSTSEVRPPHMIMTLTHF